MNDGTIEFPPADEVVTRRILERHARERPDEHAASGPSGESWTWAQALANAYRSAQCLRSLGVRPGDHVLLFLPNGLDWLRAWWGIASLGAVMVTVNTAYRGDILRRVCEDSGAALIVTTPELAERLEAADIRLQVVVPPALLAGSPIPLDDESAEFEVWTVHAVNFTSGTTGPAKGVITPYLATYMGGINVMGAAGGLTAQDRWLVDTPLFHVSGQMTALACISAGASMAIREQFAGTNYWQVAAETGATHSLLVATMANFLLSRSPSPGDQAHRLRVVVLAPMVSDPAGFRTRFGVEQLGSVYGQTEISSPLLIAPGAEIIMGSVGRPRRGAELRIVDEHDRPLPVGAVGELVVRTDRPWEMNLGYLGHPAESIAAWRNGWFHTGDAFRRDLAGNFYYVDRLRDTLRRRGENISSFHIEGEALSHPDVLECACVGVASPLGEDEVKIFVVPRPERAVDPAALVTYLADRLPGFMVPRFVEVVDELPKNQTLRIQKLELRARGNSSATWDRHTASPMTIGSPVPVE
ncbi:AMP-binding protein [Mycobacterium marseillense]|uniref:AMP-binding protein n=1 Tax=Mycobacterium marseillense TaxID=701042 RepID=UPI0011A7D052|nr:AMP-binding protein [Mycobacterium marseillense]